VRDPPTLAGLHRRHDLSSSGRSRPARPLDAQPAAGRLAHVDAVRPLTQVGVVTTHCLLFFAPAASVTAGGILLVSHATRFTFMFLAALVLVCAYPELHRDRLGRFWRHRLLTLALPYGAWNAIYFLFESLHLRGMPVAFERTGGITSDMLTSVSHLGFLLVTGYYQLWFVLLLLEFSVLYPAYLLLLRRTERHHLALIVGSVVLQMTLSGLGHWDILPGWMQGAAATRELWNYQVYLVAGGIVGWHYQQIHAWVSRHWCRVLAVSLLALTVAEALYLAAALHLVAGLGSDPSGPIQPITVPLFLAVIADLYVAGVALAGSPWLRERAWLRSAADRSYGVYLSQVLFIGLLTVVGWQHLDTVVPWPLIVVGAVVIVYGSATALMTVLARLPGARAMTGRSRITGAA
jgi:peptidoglycan/LPS O-acetylase OafA/YrhL